MLIDITINKKKALDLLNEISSYLAEENPSDEFHFKIDKYSVDDVSDLLSTFSDYDIEGEVRERDLEDEFLEHNLNHASDQDIKDECFNRDILIIDEMKTNDAEVKSIEIETLYDQLKYELLCKAFYSYKLEELQTLFRTK